MAGPRTSNYIPGVPADAVQVAEYGSPAAIELLDATQLTFNLETTVIEHCLRCSLRRGRRAVRHDGRETYRNWAAVRARFLSG